MKQIQLQKIDPIADAIKNRKETYYGIYADSGTALEKFDTIELATYYLKNLSESSLRYFLEQQIIAAGEDHKEILSK